MPNKILLTGASGTVGYPLLQMMVQAGTYDITAFDKQTKRSRRLLEKYRSRVNLIYGDLSSREDVEHACIDKDVVIHLAAVIPPLADDEPKVAHNVNVLGTRTLLSRLKNALPRHFSYSVLPLRFMVTE